MRESKNRVSALYLPIFCRELHQMVHSGISPEEGLSLLLEDETDGETRLWLEALQGGMESGLSFAAAVAETGAFPKYMTDTLSLAEETVRLEDVLDTLCRHYERQNRMRSDIVSAVTTPMVLLVVMVAVVILLFLMIASSTEREDEKARANQRRYWAHYYDKDQVEARKRGTDRRAPVPYRDELDEYELYETIFDDD